MSRRLQENIVAGLLLGTFIVLLAMALGYGPRARLVPIPIAGIAIVLLVIQIAWQNLRPTDDLQVDAAKLLTGRDLDSRDADALEAMPARQRLRRELTALGFVLALLALFAVLSPIPAIFLFTAGFLMLSGYYRPLKSIVVAAIFAGALLVVFRFALSIPLDDTLFGYYVDVLWFL